MSEDVDVDAAVEELKVKANQARAALANIRGTGTAGNGTITAIVDSAGHLRDLQLTRDALRWGTRLAAMILQATAAAEKDATAQAEQAMRPLTADARVAAGLQTMRKTFGQQESQDQARRQMTEDEIQAADDEFFERRNRYGWNT
ncbi:YbaB/EbfC family nucleoid-associated protein [Nocardia sp. NPDC052566]|uniref:YbaB/EbfC family nucleoid-associated protein n=1 Tax=Nocardia sp. NPDC052566 TaxID=3364330 RepID=UPI0037C621E9